MTPIDYSRKSIGIFLAIAICIGAGALMAIFISNGATFSDVKYFGIVAGVLALLCIVSDITSNIKNKKKIMWMCIIHPMGNIGLNLLSKVLISDKIPNISENFI